MKNKLVRGRFTIGLQNAETYLTLERLAAWNDLRRFVGLPALDQAEGTRRIAAMFSAEFNALAVKIRAVSIESEVAP